MGLANRVGFMSKVLMDHVTGGSTPLQVSLNVNFRCNFKCGYCYGQYPFRTEKDFTKEDLFGLIDDLGKMGTRSITLGGGEPMIRNDIGEIIRRVKKNGIECGMNTNGSLIPRRLKDLEAIDMVCVSFDGPKHMNDLNRGEGTYEEIRAGIDAALAAGMKTHISAVLTRHNCDAVDWIVNYSVEKGIHCEFNLLFEQSEDKNDSDKYMAANDQMRKAVERIADLKAQGAPIVFSENVYRYIASWPDYGQRIIFDKEPDFPYIKCHAGRWMMFIDADGRVYPCVQLIDNFPALDFREVGIKKAWENCAAKRTCTACYFPCWNEFSSIMSLNPQVVVGQVLSTLKGQ